MFTDPNSKPMNQRKWWTNSMLYPVFGSTKKREAGMNGKVGTGAMILPDDRLQKGILVVSLDFELHWGVRDFLDLNRCRDRLLAARAAIPGLLNLFVEYGIHATWATVGILFCESKTELLRSVPALAPKYLQPELSAYREFATIGSDEQSDPYHYAHSLVQAIASTPHQEVGTHTFSHFYCLEDGQDINAFKADLKAAIAAARRVGLDVESLVFPRNQVNPKYLAACAEMGIKVYRGTNSGWIYAPRKRHQESLVRRGVRLIDCYLDISGHNTYDPEDILGTPINLPSSRYLWMSSRVLSPLEPLRIRRIRKELLHAAEYGRVYHLWLHPEDVGIHKDRNIAFLRRVFDTFAGARDRGEIESLNMREVVNRLAGEKSGLSVFAGCPPSAAATNEQIGSL